MSQRIMMRVADRTRPLGFDDEASPLVTSADTGWTGLPVESHRLATWEGDTVAGPVPGEHGILVYLSGTVRVDALASDRAIVRQATAGDASFMCGDDCLRYRRIQGSAEVLAIHLPTEWTQRALGDNVAALSRTVPLGKDSTLISLARELRAEVERRGTSGRLFAESLSLAFVTYAATKLRAGAEGDLGRTLTPAECRVLRDVIMARMGDDLSLTELAAVVGLRPRHFSSLFSRAFGCSPYRYVLNVRLAEAARLLSSTRSDVARVAYELGFCSQSHFTAMFRKAYGVTPRRYASGRQRAIFR